MTEKLLQFIWQYKLFDITKVAFTTKNDVVKILHVGTLNTNEGPDFENGKIKIGDTTWVGNIELHIKASDWLKHKHQFQTTYNKVILHVVYEADMDVLDNLGNVIPCIALKSAIDETMLLAYEDLIQNTKPIACQAKMHLVKSITQLQQWDKMVIERLLQKSTYLEELLQQTNNNWSEVFYLHVAKVFGGNINGEAFMALASRLPLKIILKHKNNLIQLEALLFGIAGLIPTKNEHNETYIAALQTEFEFLRKLHGLQTMDVTRWKFMRMRPANFPTIRIAQFANLLFNASFLFSAVLEKHLQVKELENLFQCQASSYWDNTFTFHGEQASIETKKIGKMQIHNILINAVSPILYVYGKQMDSKTHTEQALQLLQALPAEKNKITKYFEHFGLKNENAYSSQAFLHQFKYYCTPRNCLSCSIGFSILKSGNKDSVT
jgi:hypothetical protein